MKFTDVNPFSNKIQKSIIKSITKTIKKRDFILGSNVKKFENKFSKLSNSRYSIGCGNGTDALLLALKSLNLKVHHEIIIPGMSYISTGLCVSLNQNKIVYADIEDSTGLISLESVKKKITKNTKAVIPVNLYGQRVDVKRLRKIVGKSIFIIEDSAQSHFSSACIDCKNFDHLFCFRKENNHKFADLSCYSFYPSKNLGAYGDGGIITTNNGYLNKRIRILRNLGSVKKNKHNYEGLNSRLDTLQASILLEKIKYTHIHNNYRRKIADFYDYELSDLNNVKLTRTDPGSSRHLYVIRVRERDKLARYLLKNKIPIQFHYPYSLNKSGALSKHKKVKLINSERWAKECISLPIYPEMPISNAKRVVNVIKRFYNDI